MVRLICIALATLLWAGISTGQEPQPEPAPAPAEAADETETAEVPIDQSTPRGAVKVLTRAMEQGDPQAIRQVLHADQEIEERVAQAMVEMAEVVGQLRRAAIERFGEEEAGPLIGDPATVRAQTYRRIDQAEETIEDDRAVVRSADDPRAIVLHRVEGRWVVPVEELVRDAAEQEVEQRLIEMRTVTRVVRQMAVELEAGQFPDARSAAKALDARQIEAILGPRTPEQRERAPAPQVEDEPATPEPAPAGQPAPAPAPELEDD